MQVREHRGWAHGLAPGMDHDINCLGCSREAAEGITPVITGTDDTPGDEGDR